MQRNSQAYNIINILHIYLVVLIIALVGVMVVKFYHHYYHAAKAPRQQAIEILVNYKADNFDNVLRERKENTIYVLAIILSTALGFCSLFLSWRYWQPVLTKADLSRLYYGLMGSSILLFSLFFYFSTYPSYHVLTIAQRLKFYNSPLVFISAILLSCTAIFYQKKVSVYWQNCFKVVAIILVTTLSLLVASYEIFDQNSTTIEGVAINFSPIVYPIIQQYLGGNLLVDFKSYYGLYPYFLQFFFLVFPPTVLTLSTMLALLFCISLLLLARIIFAVVENKFLALLGFFALLFVQNFAVAWWPNDSALQFQYEPIRLLFPVILLVLLVDFCRVASTKKYYTILSLAAIATLWNLDSGIPVFITTVIFLGHEKLKNNFTAKIFFTHLLNSVSALLLTWFALIFYVKLHSGSWPNLSWIVYGQLAAYNYAIAMLPAEAAGLWYLTVIVYVIGLVLSLSNFLTKNHSLQNSMMLALTILGIGLFTYFVGRSHEANLLHCSYPAVILLVIFADKFCHKFADQSYRDLRADVIIFAIPLFFISYFAVLLFSNIVDDELLRQRFITQKFSPETISSKPYWIAESEFIKDHIDFAPKKIRQDILTITNNDQDFYFDLELKTRSPLNIINIRQSFYQEDFARIYDLIISQKQRFVILILSQKKEVPSSISPEEISHLHKLLQEHYSLSAVRQFGVDDAVYIYQSTNTKSEDVE